MKILTVLRIVPMAVGLCFLNGCSTPSPLSELTISLDAIKPAAGASSNDAELTIHFVNANEVAAAISHSTYKLYLAGNYVGKAHSETALPLARMGSQTETVKIHFEKTDAVEKALATATNGTVPYRLESEVFYDVDESHESSKVTQNGTVDIHALGK